MLLAFKSFCNFKGRRVIVFAVYSRVAYDARIPHEGHVPCRRVQSDECTQRETRSVGVINGHRVSPAGAITKLPKHLRKITHSVYTFI